MDRPPNPGWESEQFTYKPATEWDEHWAAVDVPTARRIFNDFLDVFPGTSQATLIP